MKQSFPALAAAVLAVGLAAPADGGQVQIQIRDGRVTLHAKDATPREILAEWARIGQTRIVNAERVPGEPLTITLTDVPETKALDVILRSAAGYLAAPRAAGTAAPSQYDRIIVLALARPPAGVPAPTAQQPTPANRFQRPARMRPQQQPAVLLDDQDEPVPQEPEPAMEEPQGAPQPGMPTQQPGGAGNVPGTPASLTWPTPGMPTGVPSATRPGMPTPPPRTPGGPGEQQPPQQSEQPQEPRER